MILYHGTNEQFTDIDLSKSRVGKDFGAGFYLTPEEVVAKRQGQRKYAQFGSGSPTVMAFNWQPTEELSILKFDHYCLEWAEFILLNRNNKTRTQKHQFDVVIGPIADDTVGFQIRRFEDGIISMNQFLEEIKYNVVTIQYLFATEKAISTLQPL